MPVVRAVSADALQREHCCFYAHHRGPFSNLRFAVVDCTPVAMQRTVDFEKKYDMDRVILPSKTHYFPPSI